MAFDENKSVDHDLLIRLEGKVDSILVQLKDIPIIENKVRDLEIESSKRETQIKTVCEDIKNLKSKNEAWSLWNTIAIVIGTILGIGVK